MIVHARLVCTGLRRHGAILIKLADTGHFSFLDSQTLLQQAACGLGKADQAAVRNGCALSRVSFINQLVAAAPQECMGAYERLDWIMKSTGLKYELEFK